MTQLVALTGWECCSCRECSCSLGEVEAVDKDQNGFPICEHCDLSKYLEVFPVFNGEAVRYAGRYMKTIPGADPVALALADIFQGFRRHENSYMDVVADEDLYIYVGKKLIQKYVSLYATKPKGEER